MSIASQLLMDLAHRCVRETLALVRAGRVDEALEVANLAASSYEKAVSRMDDAEGELFFELAMRIPHPQETKKAAAKA